MSATREVYSPDCAPSAPRISPGTRITTAIVAFNARHPKLSDFLLDGTAGAIAGATTGVVVGIPEYLKVELQSRGPVVLSRGPTYVNAVRTAPTFAGFFSVVCGLEFSVNAEIGKHYGEYAGVFASATTGGLILSSADHVMYQRSFHKIGTRGALAHMTLRTLPTGFAPMFAREAMFITTVMHLGPWAGRTLRARGTLGEGLSGERENMFAGRLSAGLLMTALSHPFDSLAREMQRFRLAHGSGGVHPTIAGCMRTMMDNRRTFHGVVPRLGLAAFGGAMAGDVFDRARTVLGAGRLHLLQRSNE